MSVIIFLSCNGKGCDTILPVDAEDVVTARIEARNKGWDTTRHYDEPNNRWVTTDECGVHKRPRNGNGPAVLTDRVSREDCVRGRNCPGLESWVEAKAADAIAVFDWCGHDNLGHRMANNLVREGFTTVEKVESADEATVLDVRNFGRLCFERWQAFRTVTADA